MRATLDGMEEAEIEELLRLALEEDCLFVEVVEKRDVELGGYFH